MPRRRRTSRRRTTVSTKRIARIAKAVVKKQIDYKDYHVAVTTSPLTAHATVASLPPLVNRPAYIDTAGLYYPNQSDSIRTGTKIYIDKITVGLTLQATASTAPKANARLMLVRRAANMGLGINPIDVLQYSNQPEALASMKQDDTGYNVLFDRTYRFGNQDPKPNTIKKTLRFKRPLVVKYFDASTGGDAADIATGHLEWLMVTDDPTGTFSFSTKVTFHEV